MFHKNFGPDTPQLFKGLDLDDTIFPRCEFFRPPLSLFHKNAHTLPGLQHAQRRHGHCYRRRNNTLMDHIGPLASLPDNCSISTYYSKIFFFWFTDEIFHPIIAIDNTLHKVVKLENLEDALRVLKKASKLQTLKEIKHPGKKALVNRVFDRSMSSNNLRTLGSNLILSTRGSVPSTLRSKSNGSKNENY